MNYGTDLMLAKGQGKMYGDDKAKPRSGWAKGQGEGMGGYNASAVNKAMESIKGGGGKPEYYCAGGRK